MSDSKFYDGSRLLNMMDENGGKPEIFIVCGNRSSGKTTYFGRLLINRFKKHGSKFILLYRYKYEVKDAESKFFADIQRLFFPTDEIKGKTIGNKSMREISLNDEICGYALALNCADAIKKYSHFLSDCTSILFDEFQPETGQYTMDELTKFMSIHNSVARGGGEQSRYLPVYMLSNTVSKINPYFQALGVNKKMRRNSKFIKGNGWVCEINHNESSDQAIRSSTFNRAFMNNQYLGYAAGGSFMDNEKLIGRPEGQGVYIATVRDMSGDLFAITKVEDMYYCTTNIDPNFGLKISTRITEADDNFIGVATNSDFMKSLFYAHLQGKIWYEDLFCKSAMHELLFRV